MAKARHHKEEKMHNAGKKQQAHLEMLHEEHHPVKKAVKKAIKKQHQKAK